jgi:hypothetical protein
MIPLLFAIGFYRKTWRRTYSIMLIALVIDIDHVFASPMYDPTRCSMGFHPLHTIIPILIYVSALLPSKTRALGIGLCIHMILDSTDCYVNGGIWYFE